MVCLGNMCVATLRKGDNDDDDDDNDDDNNNNNKSVPYGGAQFVCLFVDCAILMTWQQHSYLLSAKSIVH